MNQIDAQRTDNNKQVAITDLIAVTIRNSAKEKVYGNYITSRRQAPEVGKIMLYRTKCNHSWRRGNGR